jgi:cholesterol transport system auxiliary component
MKHLIAAALLSLLAACSLPLTAPQADITHTLTLSAQASVPLAIPVGSTIQVAAPTAAPGYDTPAMAYRPSAHELRYFARQRWIDRPARLLGQALMDGFSAGGARALAPGSGVRTDYRLLSELLQLEQDFTRQPSRVVLSVRLQLVDVGSRRVLGCRTLRLEQAAASDDPAGGVAAANVLVERAVVESAGFCRELLGI